MLPDVSPEMLNISRNIKYIFTGNLDAKVVVNPHFPGTEKDLLRSQIARISHGANIVPKDLYTFEEGEEEESGPKKIKFSEE